MAFSSLKPCSRIMRASPHQTDQQQKEAYHLLQDHKEQHQAAEAQREVHVPTSRKTLCEPDSPPTTGSEPSFQEELPTFIAHQGYAPLHFEQKIECKLDVGYPASAWFKKEQQLSKDQLLCPFAPKESHSHSTYSHIALPPPPDVPRHTHKLSFMRTDPKKHSAEQDNHNKQRASYRKNVCATNSIFGVTLEQAIPVRQELGLEKRRNSSASVQDMLSFREVVSSKERCHDGRSSSSWEEEVRQAMARSLLGKKKGEDVPELQRSTSVKEHGNSVYPPTLLVRTTGESGKVDATAACSETGSKLYKQPLQKANFLEQGLWRGFNVKSPSEERWEEAAEVEEQQELQRRARSQSMRYETSSRSAELMGVGGPWDTSSSGNVANDDEWAVYKKSGYVKRSSGTFAAPVCCSSLLGRSLSMRDTRMGLVMECAACGAALHGAGGQLLCFCSCCAGARASSLQGGTAAPVKKKGGILRACRRLLGLGKKRSSDTQM